MTYKFLPEAEIDLLAAIGYYEACEPSLGIDMAIEVDRAITRIVEYPTAWPALDIDLSIDIIQNLSHYPNKYK